VRTRWICIALMVAAIVAPISAFGAGSKTNGEETRALQRTFVAEDADTTTVRYVALYTGTLSDASSNPLTGECAYTSYARVVVPRTTGGWTVSGNTVSNAAEITFPPSPSGTETAAYFAILRKVGASVTILYWGQLTTPLAIATNVQPEFAIGALTVTED
jgi:hypothetical protein